MLCEPLTKDGILLLAPTGKARVRLSKATNAEAKTVAQFLNHLGRYDGSRQRPRFAGTKKHRKEKTVVIDECSMLTMDDIVAVLQALDLAPRSASDPRRRSEPTSPYWRGAALRRSRRLPRNNVRAGPRWHTAGQCALQAHRGGPSRDPSHRRIRRASPSLLVHQRAATSRCRPRPERS